MGGRSVRTSWSGIPVFGKKRMMDDKAGAKRGERGSRHRDRTHPWRLISQCEGIHWPDLDEDISVDVLALIVETALQTECVEERCGAGWMNEEELS